MKFCHNGERVSGSDYANSLSELKGRAGIEGFFETMACVSAHLPLKEFHRARLYRSLVSRGSGRGFEPTVAKYFEPDLVQLNLPEKGVLKYQVLFEPETNTPHRFLQIMPPRDYPESYWREGVDVCINFEAMPLALDHHGIKSIERAFYERATHEYSQTDCADALILNSRAEVLEGTKTNLFGIKNNTLITPALSAGGVAGVMRAFIVQLATRLGVSVRIETVKIEDLLDMDAVFVSNALIGLWPLRVLFQSEKCLKDWSRECGDTPHPLIVQLQNNLPKGLVHA